MARDAFYGEAPRTCSWRISNETSHVMGKGPCGLRVRDTIGGKDYCAKHAHYARAKLFGRLLIVLRRVVEAEPRRAKPTAAMREARALLKELDQ